MAATLQTRFIYKMDIKEAVDLLLLNKKGE